jgi:hypothetical protein
MTWQKGQTGNPNGRPHGRLNKFAQQLVADFAANWREHGAAAIEQLRKENIVAYVKIATSLMPRELLLQVARPMEQMSDAELQEAALQEREHANMLIEHVRMRGGAQLIEAAQRELTGEDADDEA